MIGEVGIGVGGGSRRSGEEEAGGLGRRQPSPFTSGQLASLTATDADEAPGPHGLSSASACLNDRVREAAKWLLQ